MDRTRPTSTSSASRRWVEGRLRVIDEVRSAGTGSLRGLVAQVSKVYASGSRRTAELPEMLWRLATDLRSRTPDGLIVRGVRPTCGATQGHALTVVEPCILRHGNSTVVTAESHVILLRKERAAVISGMLPGGAETHLFERLVDRVGKPTSITEVLLESATLWPLLAKVRSWQRMNGSGDPLSAIVTPYADGLLLARTTRLNDMLSTGLIGTSIDSQGVRQWSIPDPYQCDGARMWMEVKTFVSHSQLSPEQIDLRNRLSLFTREHGDAVAAEAWSWRIGDRLDERPVCDAARAFLIKRIDSKKSREALDALNDLLMSVAWRTEVERGIANQQRRRRRA